MDPISLAITVAALGTAAAVGYESYQEIENKLNEPPLIPEVSVWAEETVSATIEKLITSKQQADFSTGFTESFDFTCDKILKTTVALLSKSREIENLEERRRMQKSILDLLETCQASDISMTTSISLDSVVQALSLIDSRDSINIQNDLSAAVTSKDDALGQAMKKITNSKNDSISQKLKSVSDTLIQTVIKSEQTIRNTFTSVQSIKIDSTNVSHVSQRAAFKVISRVLMESKELSDQMESLYTSLKNEASVRIAPSYVTTIILVLAFILLGGTALIIMKKAIMDFS